MKVLVTGGTGFVGSHSVAALVSLGHQVRLLVRSRDRVVRSLSPLGVADVESVVGDVTAPGSVEEAMPHCDDSRTASELGITARDLRVTLTDTVRWLAGQGHLPAIPAADAAAT